MDAIIDGDFVVLIAVFTFLVFSVTVWLVLYCTKDGRLLLGFKSECGQCESCGGDK